MEQLSKFATEPYERACYVIKNFLFYNKKEKICPFYNDRENKMGFWSDTFRVVNAVVTLGGSEEMLKAEERYQKAYQKYQPLYDDTVLMQSEMEQYLKKAGELITESNFILQRVKKVFTFVKQKNINGAQDQFHIQTIKKINTFTDNHNHALDAGFGGAVGGALAVGAWGLVSVIGSASTGTAIATLSGAAATNATLAWFGGGALAAGGAGMSGGMMVLGGIVAIPMIIFATSGAYKKADEINEKLKELNEAITELKKQHGELVKRREIVKNYAEKIFYTCSAFCYESNELLKCLYPYGGWSKLAAMLRKLFFGRKYTDQQLLIIEKIEEKTKEFLSNFEGVSLT